MSEQGTSIEIKGLFYKTVKRLMYVKEEGPKMIQKIMKLLKIYSIFHFDKTFRFNFTDDKDRIREGFY